MSAYTRGTLGPSNGSKLRDAIVLNSNSKPGLWDIYGGQGRILMALMHPSLGHPPVSSIARIKSPTGVSLCSYVHG